MTSKTKDQIKAFFELGDRPTESQFVDLIDSYVDKSGPIGQIETLASANNQGFVFVSGGHGEVLNAAAARSFMGITVYTTADVGNAIPDDSITYAKLQNASATKKLLGRKSAGSGDFEECSLSEALDFITSAAQGDILYRGASVWERLAAGTSGYALKTQGAGANPTWGAFGQLNHAEFTSSGTFTTSANITASTVFKITATGGGGGTQNGSSEHSAGAGATFILFITGLAPSTGYTVTIGAGGSGPSDGGATTIVINGTTYTANGGKQSNGAPGVGGTATNGTVNLSGGSGMSSGTGGKAVGGASYYGGGGVDGDATAYGAGAGASSATTRSGKSGILTIEWFE